MPDFGVFVVGLLVPEHLSVVVLLAELVLELKDLGTSGDITCGAVTDGVGRFSTIGGGMLSCPCPASLVEGVGSSWSSCLISCLITGTILALGTAWISSGSWNHIK